MKANEWICDCERDGPRWRLVGWVNRIKGFHVYLEIIEYTKIRPHGLICGEDDLSH